MGIENRDFKVSTDKPAPLSEQETIIHYDKETDTWHFYSNNPVHCRKWEQAIVSSDTCLSLKVYHEETGKLIAIDGLISGSVSIKKTRKITDEQRLQAQERMKAINESKMLS